jgi:hypothetical protein
MNHSIHFFIMSLFFFINGASTCICAKGKGTGPYCGGELFKAGGGK